MTSKRLKKGFTTGAAAAAAAKAALLFIVSRETRETVEIEALTGEQISVAIHELKMVSGHRAVCTVIKDAGDDPDVTHQAEIGVSLSIHSTQGPSTIEIKGGSGVGVVTKPGLEVPVGKPAINPGPVRMIRIALDRVLTQWRKTENQRIEVEIFVPRGEELAQKTLNARLGIDGGISILGTTGIVKPMSHEAYIATIKSGISVAAALGKRELVFTTGRRSERFAMALFPGIGQEGFVQTGDFFKASLELAGAEENIDGVTITVFFGKAVKMAMGFPHTHAAKSKLTMKTLSQWALDTTSSQGLAADIRQANTARHAFDFIHPDHPQLIACVGEKILASAARFSSNRLNIRCLILDFNGEPVFDSGN